MSPENKSLIERVSREHGPTNGYDAFAYIKIGEPRLNAIIDAARAEGRPTPMTNTPLSGEELKAAVERKYLTPGCIYSTSVASEWLTVRVTFPWAQRLFGLLGDMCTPEGTPPCQEPPLGNLYRDALHDAIEPVIAAIFLANKAYDNAVGNTGSPLAEVRDRAFRAARDALNAALSTRPAPSGDGLVEALKLADTALFEFVDTGVRIAKGYQCSDEEDNWRQCPSCSGWVDHYGHSPTCDLMGDIKRANEARELARQALAAHQPKNND